MITEDDARNTYEYDNYFAILPAFHDWDRGAYVGRNGGRQCEQGFRYSSAWLRMLATTATYIGLRTYRPDDDERSGGHRRRGCPACQSETDEGVVRVSRSGIEVIDPASLASRAWARDLGH